MSTTTVKDIRKSDRGLGIPFGTACHRLRKMVLFHILRKHNENVCFKCSLIIDSVAELSIEHKKPWQGVDIELFWDLENIAFSHLKCNVRESNGSIKLRKVGPVGTQWCSKCQLFLSEEMFHKKKRRWNGCYELCKPHAIIHSAKYRK